MSLVLVFFFVYYLWDIVCKVVHCVLLSQPGVSVFERLRSCSRGSVGSLLLGQLCIENRKKIKKGGPCESRTHDLGVISTTLYRLS